MSQNNRCLYNNSFTDFCNETTESIFGRLCNNYHGDNLTTTRESWIEEIEAMKNVLSSYKNEDGQIIFEYDIPRMGKRLDVVLLLKGIVFCLEFKTGKLESRDVYIDQVFDYALDLKNFHLFSQDKIIVPILIPSNRKNKTTNIQMSIYDDKVVDPIITDANGLAGVISSILNEFPNEKPVDPN